VCVCVCVRARARACIYIYQNMKKILQVDKLFMFGYLSIKVFSTHLLTVKLRSAVVMSCCMREENREFLRVRMGYRKMQLTLIHCSVNVVEETGNR
jgi:hypothetical protein